MSTALLNKFALGNERDLITPTAIQQYPLGLEITLLNTENKRIQTYLYIKAHDALTKYQAYVLDYSAVSGAEIISAAPSVIDAPGSLLIVPQVAFTSGYYGFVLIEGDGKVLKTAETYAIGDFLAFDIFVSTTSLIVNGTSGATTRTINSFAVSKTAGTGAEAIDVNLIGKRAVVLDTTS